MPHGYEKGEPICLDMRRKHSKSGATDGLTPAEYHGGNDGGHAGRHLEEKEKAVKNVPGFRR